jgi:putative membrane protein
VDHLAMRIVKKPVRKAPAWRYGTVALAAAAASWPAGALAHGAGPAGGGPARWPLDVWPVDPWLAAILAASLLAYGLGLARLWRRAGAARGVTVPRALAFAAGWLTLAVALVSPLDTLGSWLFSAHMLQHEALMVLAAPLLVLGRPLAVWLWALPPHLRSGAARACRAPVVAGPWRLLTQPSVAWGLHGVVLWGWHVPALFQAALASPALHTLQHLSFFLSALLFWWAPLGSQSRASQGAAMLYLFTTMVHTGALGALLTFAPTIWYPWYGDSAAALNVDPLWDQQLGGLVMWVPAGFAYLFAGLAVAGSMLQERQGAMS